MSFCKVGEGSEGKDQVIFLTEEDAKKPSSVVLPDASKDDAPQGLITEDGNINWNCPCLGGMAVGPCGVEFREAFSCFHYSEAEPKGADCVDKFQSMQECMQRYPELYDNDKKGGGADIATAESEAATSSTSATPSQPQENSSSASEPEPSASPAEASTTDSGETEAAQS